jgi:hypothetical protein
MTFFIKKNHFLYDVIMHLDIFSVARLAQEKVSPLVKKMEQESKFDSSVVNTLFENGVSISF